MERSLEWLAQELARQKTTVEASERAMAQYREDQNALSLEDRQNIVIARLNQLNDAATRARTNRAQKESLYTRLDSLGPKAAAADSIPEILQNPYIQSLKAQLAELERRKALLSERYGDKHPEMLTVNASIQDATRAAQSRDRQGGGLDPPRLRVGDARGADARHRARGTEGDRHRPRSQERDLHRAPARRREQPRAVSDPAASRERAPGSGQQPRQQRAPGRARRDSAGALQPQPAASGDARARLSPSWSRSAWCSDSIISTTRSRRPKTSRGWDCRSWR